MSYAYERAMGTADGQIVAAEAIEDISPGQAARDAERAARRRREEEYEARLIQMPDAQFMQELGRLTREKWTASCADTRFERSSEYWIAFDEYIKRKNQRSMPEIPPPTGVPCFDKQEATRRFEETLDDILPGPLLSPIRTYAMAARFVATPGTELNYVFLGQNRLLTAGILAIPPAIGYWAYKRKDDSIGWGIAGAVGGIYGLAAVGIGLFIAAIARYGAPQY